MGTHGRNAITDVNGNHYCCEQTMDGHDACYDFLYYFLKERKFPQNPTMSDQTEECDHIDNFAHIDYMRKIFYAGCQDPEVLLNMKIEDWMEEWGHDSENPEEVIKFNINTVDIYEEYLKTKKLRVSEGWRFIFNVGKCPKEYNCCNSINIGIDDFLKDQVVNTNKLF